MPRRREASYSRAIVVEKIVERSNEERLRLLDERSRRLSIAYDYRNLADPNRYELLRRRNALAFNEAFRERQRPRFRLETKFIYEEAFEALARDLIIKTRYGDVAYQALLDLSITAREPETPVERSLARRFIARYMKEPCRFNNSALKMTKGLLSYIRANNITQRFVFTLHRAVQLSDRTKTALLREVRASKQVIRKKRSKKRGEYYNSKKHGGSDQAKRDAKVSLGSNESYKDIFKRTLKSILNSIRSIARFFSWAFGQPESSCDTKDCGVYILPEYRSNRAKYSDLDIKDRYVLYYYRRDRGR